MNVDVDQSIHNGKNRFFTGTFHWAQTSYFWRVCSETLHQNLTYFSNSNYCYFFQKKKEEEEADASTNKAVNLPMKNEPTTTGDPEKDKKIRKINDKLTQIAKLKEQVKSGKQLEVNQLEKIKKESELLEELKSLRLWYFKLK